MSMNERPPSSQTLVWRRRFAEVYSQVRGVLAVPILRTGGMVELLSLGSLLAANFVLPFAFGREIYADYVVIVAVTFLGMALVNLPADVYYLSVGTSLGSEQRAGYMPGKLALLGLGVAVIGVAAGRPGVEVGAAVSLALGAGSLSGALHHAYLAKAVRSARMAGVAMALGNFAVPLIAVAAFGLPAIMAIASTAAFAIGTALVILRSCGAHWRWALGGKDVILVLAGLRARAVHSSLNSVGQWVGILRLGSIGPIGATGGLKLLFSVVNSAQAVLPISSSTVLASRTGTTEDLQRQNSAVLWGLVLIGGTVIALALRLGAPIIEVLYGDSFPELAQGLPLATAGVTPMVTYWAFWPISVGNSFRRRLEWSLTAIAVGTVVMMMLVGVSLTSILAIYVGAITTAAFVVSLRIGMRWRSIMVPLLAAAFVLV